MIAKGHYPCPFEVTYISGQTLAINLIKFLDAYVLRKKIIAYVKDKGSNLNIMSLTLKSVVNCDVLGFEFFFQGTCFGHAFIKTCQYATIDEKVCKCLRFISI